MSTITYRGRKMYYSSSTPHAKVYRSNRKRTKAYRGRRSSRNFANLSFLSPVPKSIKVRMRYVQDITLDPATGGGASHIFRANGMYDPDVTGTGHQPYGFDQLMTLFNHFTVVGSKCTARFNNTDSSNIYNVAIGVYDSATSSTASRIWNLERPGTTYTALGLATGGSNLKTLSKTFSTRKYFNIKNPTDVSRLQGGQVSDPTEQAYFYVIAQASASGTNPGVLDVNVTVDYVAVLQEFNMDMPQS